MEVSEPKVKKTDKTPLKNALQLDRGKEEGWNSVPTSVPREVLQPLCSHSYDMLEKTDLQGGETALVSRSRGKVKRDPEWQGCSS